MVWRFDKSVALATVVNWIDQCQNAKSKAKNKPTIRSPLKSENLCNLFWSRPSGTRIDHRKKNGSDKATRQNAVADGPTSLMRTKIGENPISAAPSSSASNAEVSIFISLFEMARSFLVGLSGRFSELPRVL